jgi:hypothetical protein
MDKLVIGIGSLVMMVIFVIVEATRDEKPYDPPPSVETKVEKKDEHSPVCIGVCVGPHIDLKNGQLKLFSTGPGLNL